MQATCPQQARNNHRYGGQDMTSKEAFGAWWRDGDRVQWGDNQGTVVKTTEDAIYVFWDHTKLTGILYRDGLAQHLKTIAVETKP
jgi:hypothetical protein